jgi:hypothetical protein
VCKSAINKCSTLVKEYRPMPFNYNVVKILISVCHEFSRGKNIYIYIYIYIFILIKRKEPDQKETTLLLELQLENG